MPTVSERTLAVVAQVTRYPAAILTPESSLEDDLGIDSVKQAEILAVLGRELGVGATPDRGALRTLADVIRFAEDAVGQAQPPAEGPRHVPTAAPPVAAPWLLRPAAPPVAAPQVAAPARSPLAAVTAPPPASVPASADALAAVTEVVARVTRYPVALLDPDADFEDDLGIDSVKQAEVMVAIAAALPAAQGFDARRDGLRTLRALADAISRSAAAAAPRSAPPSPAPASAPTASRRTGPLAGRVALVTGSGRGIGRVIAERLAAEGATVVVNAFHSRDAGLELVEELTSNGHTASFAWGSVANEAHVESIFDHIAQTWGRLDILVCNASDGLIAPFDAVTPKDWDRAFRTCVTGTHLCARAALPLMTDGGSIITMSTVTAHRYLRGFGSQGVVKAAVESLTRYLACELAPYGVRTNCVSAGPVYGPLLDSFPDADATVRHWEHITPGGELVRPEDVAATVLALVGDGAARVNGAVWVVDNGVSAQIDGRLPAGASAYAVAAR